MKNQYLLTLFTLINLVLLSSCSSNQSGYEGNNPLSQTIELVLDSAINSEKEDRIMPPIIICSFSERNDSSFLFVINSAFYHEKDLIGHTFYKDFLIIINSTNNDWKHDALVKQDKLLKTKISDDFQEFEDFNTGYNYHHKSWFYYIKDGNILERRY